jgi:hypothetical protein
LIFLLEEPSAAEMLKGILPKILPDGAHREIQTEFKIFEGKQDLEKNITRTLKAWLTPSCSFIIMRDQDSGDCFEVKNKLLRLCHAANRNDISVLVRIACRELESFYLGDLEAVERGIGLSGLASLQKKKKYREPDRLSSPSTILERLVHGKYAHISGSRAIAPYLTIDKNRSRSFKALVAGIQRQAQERS